MNHDLEVMTWEGVAETDLVANETEEHRRVVADLERQLAVAKVRAASAIARLEQLRSEAKSVLRADLAAAQALADMAEVDHQASIEQIRTEADRAVAEIVGGARQKAAELFRGIGEQQGAAK